MVLNFFKSKFEKNYTPVEEVDAVELQEWKANDERAERLFEQYQEYFTLLSDVRPDLTSIEETVQTEKGPKKVKRRLQVTEMLETDREHWRKFINTKKIKQDLAEELSDSTDSKMVIETEVEAVLDSIAEIAELRKQVVGDEEIGISIPNEVQDAYNYRVQEGITAKKKIKDYNKRLEQLLVASRGSSARKRRPAQVRAARNEYKQLKEEFSEYIENDPDAFMVMAFDRMLNMKKSFDEGGRIVETRYVKILMEQVYEKLEGGRPVFLHGELGSGKSEVAKHLSRKILSRHYLHRWETGDEDLNLAPHPKPIKPAEINYEDYVKEGMSEEEVSENTREFNKARKERLGKLEEWRKKLKDWHKERKEQAEPYLISGHRGLEAEQFIGGMKIERMKSMTPEEKTKLMMEKLAEYRSEHEKDGVAKEKLDQMMGLYEEDLKKFYDNPVEVCGYLGMFYRAMQEGRPIIIDEMNAIPHHVLILLNDLLTRVPGDNVKPMVEGVSEFTVKKGFYVIATGNWDPESADVYVGRQKIDAAYLSRFELEKYDYLPNAVDFSLLAETSTLEQEDEHKLRQENELFHMLIIRMLDNNGSLQIPEGGDDQLYRLAVVARNIQSAFSGFDVPSEYFPDATGNVERGPKDVLKENVLSLRHLIPIIERWKSEGYSKPIDVYLFNYYLERSKAREEEMLYLYEKLQTQGDFFSVSEGWPPATGEIDPATGANDDDQKFQQQAKNRILKFDTAKMLHDVDYLSGHKSGEALIDDDMPEVATMSAVEVIKMLFGRIPERTEIRLKKVNLGENGEPEGGVKAELDPVTEREIRKLSERNEELDDRVEHHVDEGGKDMQGAQDALKHGHRKSEESVEGER
ncbi:AAA family ATPase [Candidatus Falkowbacteria bacterium]|nr:AAA family ATPase [Candidatus Falkowbacteria bacterium]